MNLAIMLNDWFLSQLASPVRKVAHKKILKDRGWSIRAAAPELGVHFTHLDRVLQGTRISQELLDRIESIPQKGAAK